MINKIVTPEMSDEELDRLLQLADEPVVPKGASERMMARLAKSQSLPAANARVLPPAAWSAVPLAASLLVGIYLGMANVGSSYAVLAGAEDTTWEETDLGSGLEEAEQTADEAQS